MKQITGVDDEQRFSILTAGAAMGENVLTELGLAHEVIYRADVHTSSSDTRKVITLLVEQGVDLIVFAGGDGTARDVLDALSDSLTEQVPVSLPVIGIPAGVKIHSAVYAVTPKRAGELIALLTMNQPVSLVDAQVMDLDEQAFREGKVVARCYGYLPVPVDDIRMQLIKQGGLNHSELALQDIATDIIESMEPDVYYLIGSGSSTAEIMDQLDQKNTLLGVDIVYNKTVVASDVDEQVILAMLKGHPARIVVTIIGGQGHIFGRGNQQLSAAVIDLIVNQSATRSFDRGKKNIIIIATDEKLRSLEKRPMIADTGDEQLDKRLSGLWPVVTGYQQKTLYRLN
ncbi:MAG TPA: ATP-NAD kinase [Gammaproteobacteria bacterium]|nr:ATP-NAD kinase [Gammaproteobacteria bacterium]